MTVEREPPDTLDALVERGRAAWPSVLLPHAVARAHFADQLGGADPAASALHEGDLYLACACSVGAPGAHAAFEAAYLVQVKVFLGRMKPSPALVDEVRQALRVKLLVAAPGEAPRIAGYSGRGSLTAWVRIAAIRLAIDLSREAGPVAGAPPPVDDSEERIAAAAAIQGSGDPELAFLKERYKREFNESVRAAFASLAPDQRNLLRLSFRDGLSIDEIGALLAVHRATAARKIAAAREHILDETRRQLEARLRLRPHECESLMRMLRSQVSVSVVRLLDDAGGPISRR